MHQFVQSAIEAANQGDKNRAMSFIKEVLSANPNDVDAWLVLAAIVDEPKRKRQCLNRVLSLDPVNKLARDELFEMDRAEMGATPPFTPEEDSVSQAEPQPEPRPSSQFINPPASRPAPTEPKHISLNWSEEKSKAKPHAAPRPASKPRAGKPLVFKYSTFTRVITYVFSALFFCSFLLALHDVALLLIPCGASLLTLPAVWIVSKQVEVSEMGIRTSHLFGLGAAEVTWNEIARIQSTSMQNNLSLITKKGGSVKVTTQVAGYPAIVEILRQKRPDLFGMAQPASARSNAFSAGVEDSPSIGSDIPAAAPSFSGTRVFRKNFFKQYGMLLFVIPLCFFAAWTAYSEPANRIGASIAAVFCLIFMVLPFFQVGSVKVEPNKLTVESFIEQREFSAREVREIKMQSVRGRYGRVTNYVNIVTDKGKNYPLQGFSGGDEIIYGILHQWWESYRNR